MNYKFPQIEHINDVLPYVEGRKEFIVAERPFGYVINYNISLPDTFTMEGPEDIAGAIRRECRGIMFSPDGKIIRRPYHKFHNIGEKEETFPQNVNFSKNHVILDKLDGSMISPFMFNGYIRFGSKMGITEVAMQAEEYVSQNPKYMEFVKEYIDCGLTLIFEWCSPNNRIVLNYPEDMLILTAVRDMVTGNYLTSLENFYDIPIVDQIPKFDDIDKLVAYTRGLQDKEGFVVAFEDGHRLKIKADKYVTIHKNKELISSDRRIIELVYNNALDDCLGLLPAEDRGYVEDYVKKFFDMKAKKEYNLQTLWDYINTKYDVSDRKIIALEVVPNLKNGDSKFVFGMIDGKDLNDMIEQNIKKNLTHEKNFDKLIEWLQGE